MVFSQNEFDIRVEWGRHGVTLLAPISDVVIIVDVLSFSTSVEIATSRKATVYPYDAGVIELTPREYADSIGAEVAERERGASLSLSPTSLSRIPEGMRIVLPSPNGSRLSLATGNTPTLAGCIRNARAVAEAAQKYGQRLAIIPAGERWPDGSLRPSLEDWIGAGAMVHFLSGRASPEARAAGFTFESVQHELEALLLQCSSGKELIERGFSGDVLLASEWNISNCVPVLRAGAYVAQTEG